jgi:hypothetical protein
MRAPYFALIGFTLLGAGWAEAAAVTSPGPYFYIQLYADDGSSWSPDTDFFVTSSSTSLTIEEATEEGFTENQFCPDGDWEKCTCDPGARLETGPDATDFDGSYTIETNANGTAMYDFVNIGPNIETVTITTTITTAEEDETYTCSSDLFNFCGYKVSDPEGTETLSLIFTDPIYPGGIPTAVPEPAQYPLLLIALGAGIAGYRMRSRRAAA